MTLSEETEELEKCHIQDFTVPAGNVPASPFLVNRVVYQHKDEVYEAKGGQLVNQLHKNEFQTEVENIVHVLKKWRETEIAQVLEECKEAETVQDLEKLRETDKGEIWISDTLSADMNFSLPVGVSPPENTLQVFFIGECMPCFVLTLYNIPSKNALRPSDDTKKIHKFTTSTVKRLKSSLLNFCHDEFTILPCTLDIQDLSVESLKQELEIREEGRRQFYDGFIRLQTTVFNNVKQAAVLLQGTSRVPLYIPSAPQHVDDNEDSLILLDRAWRATMHQLIEYLTHPVQTPVKDTCKSAWKVKVAVLEAAYRVARRTAVTITSSNNEVNGCVEKLLESHKGETKLRLEKKDKFDGSFCVTSDFSAITFEQLQTQQDVATVTVTAKGSRRQESTAMGETEVDVACSGQITENKTVTLPTKEEMVTMENDTGEKVADRTNFDLTGKGAVTLASDPEVSEMAASKAERGGTDNHPAQGPATVTSSSEKDVKSFVAAEKQGSQTREVSRGQPNFEYSKTRKIVPYTYTQEYLPSYLDDLYREATMLFGFDNIWVSEGVLRVKKYDGNTEEVRSFSYLREMFEAQCLHMYRKVPLLDTGRFQGTLRYIHAVTASFSNCKTDERQPDTSAGNCSLQKTTCKFLPWT